jgi:hypothetical protein
MGESVAADDITGRNNCPAHLRITALWLYDATKRHIYQVGPVPSRAEKETSNKGFRGIHCWIMIDGRRIKAKKIDALTRLTGIRAGTFRAARLRAKKEGDSETVTGGYSWGWML